jgi:hypothetical protein
MSQVTANTVLANATVEQIAQVKGIGMALAQRIKDGLPYESFSHMVLSVKGLGNANSQALHEALYAAIKRDSASAGDTYDDSREYRRGQGSTRCYAVYARSDKGRFLVEAAMAAQQSDVERTHKTMRKSLLDWMEERPDVRFSLKQISLGLYRRWEQKGKAPLRV